MSEISIGSVVQLKSGGPYMTVSDLGDYTGSGGPLEGAYCVWFEKEKRIDSVFDIRTLVPTGD